jgi:hypothetical protein
MKTTLALLAVLAALVACGPASGTSPTSPAAAPPTSAPQGSVPTPGPEATPASSADSAYGDVSSYVACEIVPPQDVADLIGAPLFRELEQPRIPTCTYELVAGPTDYAQWIVYIQPTDWVEPMMQEMPETLGDPVPGLGDVAYLKYDEATELYDLLILVKGRFGLEVIGDGKDWTVAIANLFLSRMLGP